MPRSFIVAITAAAFAISACIGTAVPTGAVEIAFSVKEKSIIASFYGDDSGSRGKGKGKKKKNKGVGNQGIPPGLAKKGKLPPGIAKRQLPAPLVAQLPPPPHGYERVIVDNDVLLVDIATQVVHDILTDVFH
jgi:hypothetical protein